MFDSSWRYICIIFFFWNRQNVVGCLKLNKYVCRSCVRKPFLLFLVVWTNRRLHKAKMLELKIFRQLVSCSCVQVLSFSQKINGKSMAHLEIVTLSLTNAGFASHSGVNARMYQATLYCIFYYMADLWRQNRQYFLSLLLLLLLVVRSFVRSLATKRSTYQQTPAIKT